MPKIKFQISNNEYDYQTNKNVLPISDLPLSLIPKGPPKTGEIYLRLVHEEAKKCPNVVRKELPNSKETKITKNTKNINYLRQFFNRFEEEKEKEERNNQLIPSYLKALKPWKDYFIKEFEIQRKIFNKKNMPDNYIKEIFPVLEDESNWKVYLYGKSKKNYIKKVNVNLLNKDYTPEDKKNQGLNVFNENKKRKIFESNIENNKKICINNINSCNTFDYNIDINSNELKIEGRKPLLTIVKQMNQKVINKIIYYHSLWIKNSITKKQYQWLYALLIGLDPLLTSSQISVLRDICKQCKIHREQIYKASIECNYDSNNVNNKILSEEVKNDLIEKIAPLNIIITIITIYFSQNDLE